MAASATGRAADGSALDWRSQWPLILGFFVLLVVAGISVWLTLDNRRQNDLVAHTLEVESTAFRFFAFVQTAETGQRGYLLAGRPEYDDRHREGMAGAPSAYAALVRLTADNPSQQRRLRELKRPLDAKLAELARTMRLARAGRAEEGRAIMQGGAGRLLMNDIKAKVDALVASEEALLGERRARAESNALALLVLTLGGLLMAVAMAWLSFRSIRRYAAAIEQQRDVLRDLAENLEELVDERTADLSAANEEVQRYAYIVSHDLRAPLVNIMGFTAELDAARKDIEKFRGEALAAAPALEKSDAMRAIDTDLGESIDFIRASTAKMDRLINALLKISREGRRVLTPEPVDMTALIQNAAKAVAHQLGEADVAVGIEPLPTIVSDRLALDQVFGNLLDNAIKYLRPGVPGVIHVSAVERGANVDFSVGDNGRGIAPHDHERVFDLFRRAGLQNTRGEGIGLAHVRALVRRLGGTIAVASVPGEGSTFTVTLPRRLKDEGVLT